MMTLLMLQTETPPLPGPIESFLQFIDTPAPYSPFSEYLLVLFLLWLLARKQRPKTGFGEQAQDVLERKFQAGEIDKKAYEKYRQELTMRLKKD